MTTPADPRPVDDENDDEQGAGTSTLLERMDLDPSGIVWDDEDDEDDETE